MKFNDKTITANILINVNSEIESDFLNKYFFNENIERGNNEELNMDNEYKYYIYVNKSNITNEKINEFIKELTKYKNYNITIDSDDFNIYDNYIYNTDNNFITYKYVAEEFCGKSGQEILLGILFHTKEEKIELV